MKCRVPQIAFFLLLGAAALRPAHAQFQEPTKDELQMTSDPAAPGADAVYFYREETTDDNLHFHSYYVRLKVLTEKGKELATIHVPYEHGAFKVTDIRGRTIHPDGTVIPLSAKPSDLMEVKVGDYQVNTMVFTLPSVEVGSILEYRLQLRYDDNRVSSPDWQVQQPYFVHKAHYYFSPNSRAGIYITDSRGNTLSQLMYSVRADDKTKMVEDPKGNFSFDIANIPAIPKEDWMPPLNSVNWRVQFYYTQYHSGPDFWVTEGKRWSKESDAFAKPTKTLQEAVAGIVAPADTEEVKAQKIYAAVQALDNTDFTRSKSEAERKKEKIKDIKTAEDVWKQKSGSSDQIALLYVALGHAAGLKVYPFQVVNRDDAIFDPILLRMSQLDDYIVVANIGGKDIYLDPGEKMCPYGLLHWKHTLAAGLRDSDKGPEYASAPAETYTQNNLQRVGNLVIDPTGNVTGVLRFIFVGQEALHWRQLSLRNDPEEVKKQFNESMHAYIPDGVQADFDHFLGLDNPNSTLMGFVKVTGNIGSTTGKHFFLPGLFFESRAKHPFVAEEKRSVAIDVQYPKLEADSISYTLPEGFTVEGLPQPVSFSWPNSATFSIKSSTQDNVVTITRVLAYNYTLLKAEEYAPLRGFYQKVATADQEQLVLSRVHQAKGN